MTYLRAILLSLLYIHAVMAEIIHYDYHLIAAGQPEYLIIPKYDKHEVPHWAPGRGRSYIDVSRLEVGSTCYNDGYSPYLTTDKDTCKKVKFDLLLFEAPESHSWEDFWEDNNYCCTPELVDAGK
jgi:hypothetical protein